MLGPRDHRSWCYRPVTGHLTSQPFLSSPLARAFDDRTLAGDFGDLPAKLLRDIAINGNDAFETIDPAAAATFQFGALLAILRMDFGVRDVNADAPEGQLLVTGIEAQRHSGAGAKRNSKEVVERWSEIETAF